MSVSVSSDPQTDDATGFDAAYSNHATAVYSSARWMCGAADADDVTLRVFVDAWRSRDTFDERDEVVRKRLVAAVVFHAEDRGPDNGPSGPARRRSWRGDRSRQGFAAHGSDDSSAWCDVAALDRPERMALALAVFGGCTCEEIARLLGRSEHDIAIRLQSALRLLEGPSPAPR